MTGGQTWRTVDIVVCAAIAAAFGRVLGVESRLGGGEAGIPRVPALAIPALRHLAPARRTGRARRARAGGTEIVAASVSALIGSPWGLEAVVSGALQGVLSLVVVAARLV